MLHSDIVTLTTDGVVVHEKALQPLGIFDQSICWGVWVANPHTKPSSYNYGAAHLIISPFHPRSWPFLFRLRIKLINDKGVLADACKWLAENHLSILFAECIPDGFMHATWNIITESTKKQIQTLKSDKARFDKDHPWVRVDKENFREAQDLANKIVAEMLSQMRDIEQEFKKQINQPGLLRLRTWDKDEHFLYSAKVVDEIMGGKNKDSNSQIVKRLESQPYYVHYMRKLAYFSMYGGGLEVPFSLQYHADSALLKLEKGYIFSEFNQRMIAPPESDKKLAENKEQLPPSLPLPSAAIVTFDTYERYLRLLPITQELLEEKLTRATVEYEVENYPNPTAEDSQGLLGEICAEFAKANVNLLHVSNKWTQYGSSKEAGLISFIADLSADKYKLVEEGIKSINHILRRQPGHHLKHVKIREVSIYKYPQLKLFVSTHFGHPRDKSVRKIIKDIARKLGFDGIIIETHVKEATDTVVNKIVHCDAFLQVLWFRKEDSPESINFSWLDFEYGVASGKGLPTIRMVDTVRVTYDWWKRMITTNPDQRAIEFRSDLSDEDLTAQIRGAVEELTREVARRQQEKQ